MELARNYRREQLQYRLSLGSEWVGENYVFIQANGKQMHPDTPYNKFKSIIRCYNAHIIKETLRNFRRILILPININTSFTIYTVNSILTSLRWIYIQYKNMLQDLLLKSLILI